MNKYTVVKVYRIPVTEEVEVLTISTKLEEAVILEEGNYHDVHVLLGFNK